MNIPTVINACTILLLIVNTLVADIVAVSSKPTLNLFWQELLLLSSWSDVSSPVVPVVVHTWAAVFYQQDKSKGEDVGDEWSCK